MEIFMSLLLEIRHEKQNDITIISDLVYTAFADHPHHVPGAKPTEHLIIAGLRAERALTLSLVADSGGEIVGHIAFSEVLINGESVNWYGLGPISVHPSKQRQGVGSALIKHSLQILRDQSAQGVVLLGDPGYYARFGFQHNPDLILEGVPPNYFVALTLSGIAPAGVVTYHQAFFLSYS
jgi:putative acetyltransferase